MLSLINLKKTYSSGTKQEAIKGISLEFDNKGFISILGPSGCGKTTLLNLIGGLDDVTEGVILIDGLDLTQFNERQLDYYRSNILGFIFQGYNLINQLTIKENVMLGLDISQNKENKEELVKEALKRVGISDLASSLPQEVSGGQQQRAAIARAIVKKPKILLCDEPTGALDSVTSEEVLKILKELSNDCLVIMVTHNETLASSFSDRIITLKDGLILSDSKPQEKKETEKVILNKSKIPFFVSVKMALRNIFKKKRKNILISLASSIGIIGLSLIIGITNGFKGYLSKLETDALSKYPIQISTEAYNIETILSALESSNSSGNVNNVKYPTDDKIFITHLENTIKSYTKENNITEEYIDYLNQLDSSLYNEMIVRTNQDISLNLYSSYYYHNRYGSIGDFTENYVKDVNFSIKGTAYLSMLPESQSFLSSQYDCIYGKYPTNKNEMVLIVDEYNQIDEVAIYVLGLSNRLEDEAFKISDLVGTKYSLVLNSDRYVKESTGVYSKNTSPTLNNDLEIVGVIRPSKGSSFGMLKSGIGYTKELYNYINDMNYESEIAKDLRDEIQITLDGDGINEEECLRYFGATHKPYSVKIYPTNDESKTIIENYLDKYNDDKSYSEQIIYTDFMGVFTKTISSLVNQVSYVLYSFVALSLIVSSIMIGVITYSSIVERTKEIGILRSLGARSKDVSLIFNSENIIVGAFSGALGVLLGFTFGKLISIIIENKFSLLDIFDLNWYNSLALIGISIILSLLAGYIPAHMLSKKEPVKCIRSE